MTVQEITLIYLSPILITHKNNQINLCQLFLTFDLLLKTSKTIKNEKCVF